MYREKAQRVRTNFPWLVTGFSVTMFMLLLLASASPKVGRSTQVGVRTLQDLSGRTVAVPRTPERIVVLGPVLETIATIDRCSNRISGGLKYSILHVAATPAGVACPELARTPIANITFTPDPETIMRSNPDVVIGIRDLAANLETVGYPSLVRIDYLDDPLQSRHGVWKLTGEVLGEPQKANEMLLRLQAQMRDLYAKYGSAKGAPIRIVELFGAAREWRISGEDYYLRDVLEGVGGTSAAANVRHASSVSQEDLFLLDPDVILLTGGDNNGKPSDLYGDPTWSGLSAVKNKRVYKMLVLNQFNPPVDLYLFANWLALVLHPEADASGLYAEVEGLYRNIYGKHISVEEIDRVLAMSANAASAGMDRFTQSRFIH